MKNYRKFLVPIILIVMIVIGVSKLNIQSVKNHDLEKNDTIITETTLPSIEKADNEESHQNEAENSSQTPSTDKDKKTKKDIAETDNKKSDKKQKHSDKKKADNISEKSEETTDNKKLSENKKNSAVKDRKNASDVNKKKKDKKGSSSQKDTSDKKNEPVKEPVDESNYIKCSVTIDCSVLLSNIDKLEKNAVKYVPKSGKFLEKTNIKVKKGSSVYDIMVAACKEKKIAYDAEYSSIYNSSYVKGIGHIYEKMAGDMSGWLYLVNDMTPNVGASVYIVKEGDNITWTYTCSGRAGS